MQDWVVYLVYRCLEWIVNLVPESLAYKIGRAFGSLAYKLMSRRREIAEANLKLAFDLDEQELADLTRAHFKHLGMVIIEFLRSPQLDKQQVEEIVEIEGQEYLDAARQREEGIVIFTGHFGNWELLGICLTLMGLPMNALAKNQSNELINQHILKNRQLTGAKVFANKGMVLKKAYQALKKGEALYVIGDQKARTAEEYIKLFGVRATVALGTVDLAARTNSWILPIYLPRIEEGKYRLLIKEPIKVQGKLAKDEKIEVMQDLHSSLEEVIKEYPQQWLWIHRRWHFSPDLEEELY